MIDPVMLVAIGVLAIVAGVLYALLVIQDDKGGLMKISSMVCAMVGVVIGSVTCSALTNTSNNVTAGMILGYVSLLLVAAITAVVRRRFEDM